MGRSPANQSEVDRRVFLAWRRVFRRSPGSWQALRTFDDRLGAHLDGNRLPARTQPDGLFECLRKENLAEVDTTGPRSCSRFNQSDCVPIPITFEIREAPASRDVQGPSFAAGGRGLSTTVWV